MKERSTLLELALKYELYPNQISQWKQEFIEKSAQVFENDKPTSVSPDSDHGKLFHIASA